MVCQTPNKTKMHLRILFCCGLYMLAQGNAATTGTYDYKVARSVEIHNQEYGAKQLEDLQKRIQDEAQFIEHPNGAQSFHLLPNLTDERSKFPHQEMMVKPQYGQRQLKNTENSEQQLVLQPVSSPLPVHPYPQYKVPVRKHYKIVLVRSPTAAPAPPQPVLPEVEEKTLIYVLVKKPDEPVEAQVQELQRAQQDAFKLNKPEVYFIKYQAQNNKQAASETTHNTSTQSQHTATDFISTQKTSLDEIIRGQVDSENHKDSGYP